jgi:tetratricopeptide (TPR) repeat protein
VECQQRTEALAAAERALATNPGYGRAWSIKGWMLYQNGQIDEAQRAFEQALAAHQADTSGNAENGLALCLSACGHVDEALAVCEKLLKRMPLVASNWHYKGRVLAEAYQIEQALAAYNQALSGQVRTSL